MKIVWQTAVTIIFFVLLIGIQVFYWSNPLSIADIVRLRNTLFHLIAQYPFSSATLYIMLYAGSIIFGIPISVTLVGGYFFGVIRGIVYSLIGSAIGITILCSLVRYGIGDWLQKRYKDQLKSFNKELEKYGLHYIIMIHIIPFMPSFLPHIAAGISSISLAKVIGTNILAALPLTCLYVLAGAYLHTVDSLQSFIAYATIFSIILGILFGLVMLYRRFLND